MEAFDKGVRRATQWLALVGFLGLFILAAMSTIDAVMRSFFSRPIQGVTDVSAVVMAVVIASCIPANLAQRKNISVEVLGGILGPAVNRLLSLVASTVVFVLMAIMAWKFIPYTQGLYASGRQTWVLAWPVWPWWSVATVFLFIAAFVQFLNVITDALTLFGGHRPPPPAEAENRLETARADTLGERT